MLISQERDLNRIKYDILPELMAEMRRLKSDNDFLLDKIIELEGRLNEKEDNK